MCDASTREVKRTAGVQKNAARRRALIAATARATFSTLIACCMPIKALQHFEEARVHPRSAGQFDRAPSLALSRSSNHLCATRHALTRHETCGQGARGRRRRRGRRGRAKETLDRELAALGFDAERLEGDAALRGSAALATYRRFVIPKTAKGLRDALAPARAASVAVDVVGLARQHLAEQAAWLRGPATGRWRSGRRRRTRTWLSFWTACGAARTSGGAANRGDGRRGRVICCGTTPAPPTPAVLRAAMGCADLVRVERAPSTLETVLALRRDGFSVWACETTERS